MLDGQGDLAALKMPWAGGHDRAHAGMMQAENRVAPRIVSAENCRRGAAASPWRPGTANRGAMGGDRRIRILAVLDLDGEALAAEAKRHEAGRDAGPAVEVVDRPTWLAMQRLVAGGMITMAEGQSHILHRSPRLRGRRRSDFQFVRADRQAARGCRAHAGHGAVLARGGFHEEALPLVAKAIAVSAAAKLAALGELAAGAGMATPAQVRDLVDRGSLAPQAETVLSAVWSAAGRDAVADIGSIIEMGANVIAGLDEGKIAIAA